ncbi:MAG: GNAT superfamily N-acetyltransferase [Granulosicoccus sp.]|jgi:GNAT superfamily N-acetyltransferase
MNAFVRLAEGRDIEAICSLLHTKMNSRIPVERWRQLMSYEWFSEKPDYGRVVESDGDILGFCGMVYADRTLANNERVERIVSMSSWYLDKSVRGKGLGKAMLKSAIEDPTLTYATLTNSRKPLGIVEALGFRVLEDHRYLWRKEKAVVTSINLLHDAASIKLLVKPYQREIIDDMANLSVVPMLLQVDGQQTLLFFSIKRKKNDILWFDLMYVSDRVLFTRNAQAVASALLPDEPSILAADGRLVHKPSSEIEYEPLPVARYFVSQRVEPYELDNLYSELQLLDLKLD